MKKILAILLVLTGIVLWTLVHMPATKKLREYPTGTLSQEAKALQIQIDAEKLGGAAFDSGKTNRLEKEKFFYQVEIARRNFGLEWLGMILGLFGLGLLALQFLNQKETGRRRSKVRVTETIPAEAYVDEQEFYRRSQDAFPSKDAGLAWFENDPLRICSYCGSEAMKPVRGQTDEIQLITFYKKVPTSAKDLRIVMGSLWFVRPAEELQCENCEQRVRR
ncbi:MAG: hypothetical protein R2877_05465 [Bdellovibrionota bacterium]